MLFLQLITRFPVEALSKCDIRIMHSNDSNALTIILFTLHCIKFSDDE